MERVRDAWMAAVGRQVETVQREIEFLISVRDQLAVHLEGDGARWGVGREIEVALDRRIDPAWPPPASPATQSRPEASPTIPTVQPVAPTVVDVDVELGDGGGNVYVFDDDDAAARAFDEFYQAYDTGHAKTREFLLG